MWDVTRPFPPVRACLFSQSLTVITFLGDPSAGSGLPRGTMVFANQPIPKEVSFATVTATTPSTVTATITVNLAWVCTGRGKLENIGFSDKEFPGLKKNVGLCILCPNSLNSEMKWLNG